MQNLIIFCDVIRRFVSQQAPDMVFNPSLDLDVADGFYDLVDSLVGDIYKQASKIQRLAVHSGQYNYQVSTLRPTSMAPL